MASHHKMHMKHKHHRKAHGGAMAGRDDYAGSGEPNVVKEAKLKHGGKVHGHKGKHRIHKKRGGGVGSDRHPFSSAFTASTEAK
jgi:hypothetical protein